VTASTSSSMNSEVRTSRRPAGVVIVGGGECGAKAAMSLRKYGWPGAVTVFGAESIPDERPPPPLQRRGGSSVHPLDD
jgi:glycine/D-amino acid oxidase-like deaminating enzyme